MEAYLEGNEPDADTLRALIAALSAGQIAGAGLDVYEFEPKVPPALMAMENVTLLPHLGTAALEVSRLESVRALALDAPPSKLAFYSPPPAPATPTHAGLPRLQHVRHLERQREVRRIRGQADAKQSHQGGVLVQRIGHAQIQ